MNFAALDGLSRRGDRTRVHRLRRQPASQDLLVCRLQDYQVNIEFPAHKIDIPIINLIN